MNVGFALVMSAHQTWVRTIDGQTAQQLGPDPMLGMAHGRPLPLIDRRQAHPRHQPAHALAASGMAVTAKMPGRLPRAIPRRLHELLVDDPHQRQVLRAKSYKDRAARLIADGRMQPPGLAAIEASKRGGLWDAMADVDALVVPADLAAALEGQARAADNFHGAAPSYRRNWIKAAKGPETRARRIAQTADHAARAVKIPQM
jgi:uncharacterized protein YdeI (YjbR/CyaY-like superfamily)